MATAPKVQAAAAHPHVTAKQLAADRQNLKKARAVARTLPRTGRQIQASRHNLVKARAAQKARRSGKGAVRPQKAAAPLDSRETAPLLHQLPACAPVALAAHLAWWHGIEVPDEEILQLHRLIGGAAAIPDVIEAIADLGFCGFRPDTWTRCDVSNRGVPGLIYGVSVLTGYHAVLALPAGMLSWSTAIEWPGEPAEAWHLEWAALALSHDDPGQRRPDLHRS